MKYIKNNLIKILVLGGLFFFLTCHPETSSDIDIDQTVAKMSFNEKVDFIGGYESFNIRGYEHLGIPEVRLSDGPVGVRGYDNATAYPASICIAASWDKSIANSIGKSIGMEARKNNVHIMLGPGMNIYRMPLCGRNFEYLGEDPYLAGQIAKEYIIGMQNEGVASCAKHYAANNQEFDRNFVSSNIDERTLHEIYLPAFKTAVLDANVATVMTAYNLINDVHASENDYLNNTVLKGSWAFKGFIMSDWVSSYNGVACAKGGLDLEMPSGAMMNKEVLKVAIQQGQITQTMIDDKVKRILGVYQRFGFFENPDRTKNYKFDSTYVVSKALEAARGGMVLLENKDGILPFDKNKIKKIAVIGPNSHTAITGGGGSSFIAPKQSVSMFDAIKKIAGKNIEVVCEKGIFTGVDFPEDLFNSFDFYVYQDGKKIKGANAKYYKGKNLEGKPILETFYDKVNLKDEMFWNNKKVPKVDFSIIFDCFYSPETSGYYNIGGLGDDGFRILVDDKLVVNMWRDQGPSSANELVFMNKGQEYKIRMEYYQSGGGACINLGAKKLDSNIKTGNFAEDAILAAKDADIVIMSVGFNPKFESESFDRTFEMPYKQGELINTISKINNNIVVVVNSGGNVEMESWINNVKGLLMAWYPGQEGNIAAAEILFGETNPSGKLPVSFEYKLSDNPCYNSYFDSDSNYKVEYTEGLFLGYRHWDKSQQKPRYPFGYGLSYTDFTYNSISIVKDELYKGEIVKFDVNITNTGQLDGAEIIQVYVADIVSSLPRPVKELKAFEKIFLKKGETKTIHFELDKNAFSFYNPTTHEWEIEAGDFEIIIGSSSDKIELSKSITIR